MAVATTPAPQTIKATPSPEYILEAVNNARVALGKNALSKAECEQALSTRKAPEPYTVNPDNPLPPPFVESDAQFLVALPANYVRPTLDEGKMQTTAPTPPRSDA
jgi:hypothetical protein